MTSPSPGSVAPAIPADAIEWIRGVFQGCNERVTEKLCNNPNLPEESLDLTLIDELSRVSSPIRLPSDWIIQLHVHYLGGLRHFGQWEIADIGLLVFVRAQKRIRRNKVALFQSKRLYPTNMAVGQESVMDYLIGFARLADPEDLSLSIALERDFAFDEGCRYGALAAQSRQVQAITDYEREEGLSVYYQLYNP